MGFQSSLQVLCAKELLSNLYPECQEDVSELIMSIASALKPPLLLPPRVWSVTGTSNTCSSSITWSSFGPEQNVSLMTVFFLVMAVVPQGYSSILLTGVCVCIYPKASADGATERLLGGRASSRLKPQLKTCAQFGQRCDMS